MQLGIQEKLSLVLVILLGDYLSAKLYLIRVICVRIGYHPWFTHWIKLPDQASLSKKEHYRRLLLEPHLNMDGDHSQIVIAFEKMLPALPDPILLDGVLSDLRSNLSAHPNAMLGEVGLDRAAKVPYDHQAAQRKLSPFTIPLEHQLAIVTAQIDVALELQRNISFHSVKSQKHTMDLLSNMKQKYGPRWSCVSIDMHSCGLSIETWKEIEVRGFNAYFINYTHDRHSVCREYMSMRSCRYPYASTHAVLLTNH